MYSKGFKRELQFLGKYLFFFSRYIQPLNVYIGKETYEKLLCVGTYIYIEE